jgi:hypothetical protein
MERDLSFFDRNRPRDDATVEYVRRELSESTPSNARAGTEKFVAAAMGSVPWLGSIVATGLALRSEGDAVRRDNLLRIWLEEHEGKLRLLTAAINEVLARFHSLGDSIDARIQDEEYLQLVRRTFRVWDRADSQEKRAYAENLVVNAADTRICSDDVIRLFIDFLDTLHEIHLRVIHEVYNNNGITRLEIWRRIYGSTTREDAAEADLFRLMIRDLSTGGLIRQHRETNAEGEFIRKRPAVRRPAAASRTMDSSFDDEDEYELTALGNQFVHYVMTNTVGKIEGPIT